MSLTDLWRVDRRSEVEPCLTRSEYRVVVGKKGPAFHTCATTRVRVRDQLWELSQELSGTLAVLLLVPDEGWEYQGALERTLEGGLCAGPCGVPSELEPFACDLGWEAQSGS